MDVKPTLSLSPVQGKLDRKQILHLFRRTIFGTSQNDLHILDGKTIDECMELLLEPSPEPPKPVQQISDYEDPLVTLGQPWVDAPYENDTIQNCRDFFLKGWWMGNIVNRDYSLTEKMTLFWHNHFVVEMAMVKDARYCYRYASMLRRHSLGNFKELIKEGSTNIAMLVYLNGNHNTKAAPNENYARELLELFTIGKHNGESYTEEDVRQAAKILTGYVDNKDKLQVNFRPELHDTSDKVFSSFFNHTKIKGRQGAEGTQELNDLVEMIFTKKETSLFFCRNLYRWFVSSHITQEVEDYIIEPLSRVLVANNFEVRPVLKMLLSSEHFFDEAFRGCIVKNPIEYLVGTLKEFDVLKIHGMDVSFECWWGICLYAGKLGMYVGEPPSVSGWPAYYQAPKYHRWWANSSSLEQRKKLIESLSSPEGLVFNCPSVNYNFLAYAKNVENVEDVSTFVNYCLATLLAVEVGEEVKKHLIEILLSGLEHDRYWTEMWKNYSDSPNSPEMISLLENRLRPFFRKIMQLPEYQMA